MPEFASVDDYLASLDPPKGDTLRSVITTILDAFPDLECKLAWNVPQIHRNGQYVFGMGALTNHLDGSPWSEDVMDAFRSRFADEGYATTKHLFKYPVDWEVDRDLLVDLVGARLAELDRDDA